MVLRSVVIVVIPLLLCGCRIDQFIYSGHDQSEITVQPSWDYGCCEYGLSFSVDEDYYNDICEYPRPNPKQEYGELVNLAFGPGLSSIEELASDIEDLSPYNDSPGREIEFLVAYVRTLSYGSSFTYDTPLYYPLEVVVDGGNSSADLTVLASVLLNSLNYDVGIVVFNNPCCEGDVHVALAAAEYYPFYHGIDDQGTKWVFLETVSSAASDDISDLPYWMDNYEEWLVWPLWEHEDLQSMPRKIIQKPESLKMDS